MRRGRLVGMSHCPRCQQLVVTDHPCPSCGLRAAPGGRTAASALLGLVASGAVACMEPMYGVVGRPPGGGFPAVAIMPALLQLGEVAVGEQATGQVTVQSVGEEELTVVAVGVDPGVFTAVAPEVPARLAPGESVTVEVTFAPEEPGAATAVLTVSSDAEASQVTLEGTGAP